MSGMNDGELKKTADELSKSADAFKKELETPLSRRTKNDSATREAAVKRRTSWKKQREARLFRRPRPPASGKAQALFRLAGRGPGRGLPGRAISPATQSAWGDLQGGLGEGASQAFDVPTPVP